MVAKAGGYDALYVDMQHAPYSIETTATICAAALGIGITPLVRVPSHDPQWMSRVLDGGAQGGDPARCQYRSSRPGRSSPPAAFRRLGKRSVMGLGPALGYRAVPLAELNPKLNAETAVIVMLETAEGIENCEAIAAIDGIDVLLIGSGDLTTDSAFPDRSIILRLRAAYERVAAACRTHKKVLGVGGIRHNTVLQGELIAARGAVRYRRYRHQLRAGRRAPGHRSAARDQDRLSGTGPAGKPAIGHAAHVMPPVSARPRARGGA